MENTRNALLSCISRMGDREDAERWGAVVRTFVNRKESGSRALVFGIRHASLIQNILGTDIPELISDGKCYPARVRRVRSGADRVCVSFKAKGAPLSREEDELVRSLFTEYGADREVDLEAAAAGGHIPTLVIRRSAADLRSGLHIGIALLSGKGLVKEVSVDTSSERRGPLSACDEAVFIPASLTALVENSASVGNNDGSQPTFMETLEKETGMSVLSFNAIVLDSPDDHLFRVFRELMDAYQQHFKLDARHVHLLRRVFFISDTGFLEGSRATEEMDGDEMRLLSSLMRSPVDLCCEREDAAVYSALADLISNQDSVEASMKAEASARAANLMDEMSRSAECKSHLASTAQTEFNNYKTEVDRSMERIEAIAAEGFMDIAGAIDEFGVAVNGMLAFCQLYAHGALASTCRICDKLEGMKSVYGDTSGVKAWFGAKRRRKAFRASASELMTSMKDIWGDILEAPVDDSFWEGLERVASDCTAAG